MPNQVEWLEILEDRVLRQGDVFAWEAAEANSPWRRHGVLITADCDLLHGKHRGLLSYLPILRLDEYLSELWFPERLEREREGRFQHAIQRVEKAMKRLDPAYQGGLTEETLRHWLESRSVDGILDDIGLTDAGQRSQLRSPLAMLDALCRALKTRSIAHQWLALGGYVGAKRITEQVAGFVSTPPGDAFYLDSIGPDVDGGVFVMLRHVREIEEERVATSVDQLRRGNCLARRISAIQAPFLYRLTQMMASVFTDIGLPDEHAIRARASAARLCARLEVAE